jgi:endonuclease/exonuclease/phosphatase family metal-dependent hydrolase
MDLRILCFNIHKGIGWGIRRSTIHQIQNQISGSNSDIIFLQEIRGFQFEIITSKMWPHFSYGKNAVYQKGHHGNAILSKYPIIHSENIDLSLRRYERRGMLHSIIKLPGQEGFVHLLCVHLGLFAKDRRKQLDLIVKYIENNIVENDHIILAGDFNDWSGYATKPLIKALSLHEAFLSTKKKYAKTYPAWIPMLKLDRIYTRGFHVNYANRLTNKSWRYLSDHIALSVSLKVIT